MKRFARLRLAVLLAAIGAAIACVTVNIYFPAAKVEKTAEQIVDDVYGKDSEEEVPGDESSLGIYLASLFGPTAAYAQDATSVSNAAIRGLKAEIASNHKQLVPFYEAGNVGITRDGMLEVRSTDGLGIQDVAKLKRLVAADNKARGRLYREVASALGVEASQVSRIQGIFADQWRSKASAGWWIQTDAGSWTRK